MIELDIIFKAVGIFAIFALSLAGYLLPFHIHKVKCLRQLTAGSSWTDSSFYHNLKSFSSGVILGVSMLHLIAESVETLQLFSEYPGK